MGEQTGGREAEARGPWGDDDALLAEEVDCGFAVEEGVDLDLVHRRGDGGGGRSGGRVVGDVDGWCPDTTGSEREGGKACGPDALCSRPVGEGGTGMGDVRVFPPPQAQWTSPCPEIRA